MQITFFELANHFVDWYNKTKLVPASFFFFVTLWALYSLTKLKKLNCSIYSALAKHFWVIKLKEFKSDQKYFEREITKLWKAQKIIVTVRKLFNQYAHSWRGFAEGVLQIVLFTVLRFKSSVKKHCVANVLLAIWKTFLHENIRNYNY